MIIVFGGAFNPPTIAHQKIIDLLKEKFHPTKIICLPVGDHYAKQSLLLFEHRFEMLKRMIGLQSDVSVSDFEHQPIYQGTYKSLKHFEALYQEEIRFVIGSDHLASLNTWIRFDALLRDFTCIVIHRSGHIDMDAAENLYAEFPHHFIFLDFNHSISSSQIRSDIDRYQHQLDASVYQYIKANKLYTKESKDV